MRLNSILLATLFTTPAIAQDAELPAFFYDQIAVIAFATTAASECDRAKLRDRNMQNAMNDVMVKLASEGIDPVTAVQALETEIGQAEIKSREVALRERHGVGQEGYPALCAAIKAEAKENRAFSKLVRLR